MAVEFDVPNLEDLLDDAMRRTTERALIGIENNAKVTAPVDTGFYRNNIKRDARQSEVTANADYSAAIEYGVSGTKRAPKPVMRNAARKVQNEIPQIFRESFK